MISRIKAHLSAGHWVIWSSSEVYRPAHWPLVNFIELITASVGWHCSCCHYYYCYYCYYCLTGICLCLCWWGPFNFCAQLNDPWITGSWAGPIPIRIPKGRGHNCYMLHVIPVLRFNDWCGRVCSMLTIDFLPLCRTRWEKGQRMYVVYS